MSSIQQLSDSLELVKESLFVNDNFFSIILFFAAKPTESYSLIKNSLFLKRLKLYLKMFIKKHIK